MSAAASALPVRPGGSAPHVIVDDIDTPELDEGEFHHLSRVRRLRDGDLVSITDGRGSWRWTAFSSTGLHIVSDVAFVDRPDPLLTVGFALVKGSKPELVVQKLTEIGIDVIIPFVAERSVVRWDDAKVERQSQRLSKVAREACSQSRRVWIPVVESVLPLANLIARNEFVRADRGGAQIERTHSSILIGPEGGWSDAEVGSSPTVGLGDNVLRAETAAIAAGTLMVALRDGVIR